MKEYLILSNVGVLHADETTERIILLDDKKQGKKEMLCLVI